MFQSSQQKKNVICITVSVLIQNDMSLCFTLFCYLKFSLVLRYISNSLRWNCLWVGIPNQNGGFYFSECLRGNYINPNRNHIGVWDDKWRPWITTLLLLYLEMEKINFTALQCFSVLQFGHQVASTHLYICYKFIRKTFICIYTILKSESKVRGERLRGIIVETPLRDSSTLKTKHKTHKYISRMSAFSDNFGVSFSVLKIPAKEIRPHFIPPV